MVDVTLSQSIIGLGNELLFICQEPPPMYERNCDGRKLVHVLGELNLYEMRQELRLIVYFLAVRRTRSRMGQHYRFENFPEMADRKLPA